jgi:ribonucleases P/MRP protein subunit RPP40
MESIIRDNLMEYCLLNNVINVNQHGFIRNKSTCSQLLECQYEWCSGLDVGDFFDVIFIDFRKAFDVVPHDKLVTKLSATGICESTLCWITAFLTNRTQRVCITNNHSSDVPVTSGVIQGSVLGPLLFVLYINDLPPVCRDCSIKLYADDVKIYKRITCAMDRVALQSALDALCEWARVWELDISIDKCNYLQLGYQNLTSVYNLNSHNIVPCRSVCDLGINIESNLKPSMHCASIALKASARAKLVLKAFLSRDPKYLTRAFVVYVRPLLEYCSPVWSPHNICDINLIENVQRMFTRRLYGVCNIQQVSYEERLVFLGLERLELRRLHADLLFLFKIVNGFVACDISQVLTYASTVNTRGHRHKLFVTRCNKLVFSHFFLNRVTPIWNRLPDLCFDCHTLHTFKRKYYLI